MMVTGLASLPDMQAMGYRATWEKQSLSGRVTDVLVVHDVPIFCACQRDELIIDEKWIARAVNRAQRKEREGYLPPLHIRHHETATEMNDAVRGAGFFRITGAKPLQLDGKVRLAVVADLIVTDPQAQDEVLSMKYPYRSVELFDPKNRPPSIDGLALLDHEAPFLELPMLLVADVAGSSTRDGRRFSAGTLVHWEPDQPVVACFKKGNNLSVLFQEPPKRLAEPGEEANQIAIVAALVAHERADPDMARDFVDTLTPAESRLLVDAANDPAKLKSVMAQILGTAEDRANAIVKLTDLGVEAEEANELVNEGRAAFVNDVLEASSPRQIDAMVDGMRTRRAVRQRGPEAATQPAPEIPDVVGAVSPGGAVDQDDLAMAVDKVVDVGAMDEIQAEEWLREGGQARIDEVNQSPDSKVREMASSGNGDGKKDKKPKKEGPGVTRDEGGKFAPGGTGKKARRMTDIQPTLFKSSNDKERFADDGKAKKDDKDVETFEADESAGMDVGAIVSAIESGEISVADMKAIVAAIAAQEALDEPEADEVAPAPVPGEAMKKGDMTQRFAALQGEHDAMRAEFSEMKAAQERERDVAEALTRLEGRPLGADLEEKLVKFHAEHGASAFKAYIDSMAQAVGVLPSKGAKTEAFRGQDGKVSPIAMKYQNQGTDAVDAAERYAREWEELKGWNTGMKCSQEAYVELYMAREAAQES